MGYDRYDNRDDRSRWSSDDRYSTRGREGRGRDERGFFERAGDEIASWFGDDDRGRDGSRDYGRDRDPRDSDYRGFGEVRGDRYQRDQDRSGWMGGSRGDTGRFARSDDRFRGRETFGGGDRDDYRPMTGDYGRAGRFRDDERGERSFRSSSGMGGIGRDRGERMFGRSDSNFGDDRDLTSFAGSRDRSGHDPQYRALRDRQMADLDRDYDDYRREHQSKFENDFGSWRDRRQSKRQLTGQIREHMEVVGNDDQHVGTVDKVSGDRIILTKSDPEAGGAHHSLTCHDIDRIENDRIILDCSAEQAKSRWQDETRNRALFEREDQGQGGAHMLDRSFSGTYRD